MRSRIFAGASLAAFSLATVFASGQARAGGLGRPTPFSARAYGLGGAFSAVADDPTALHYNPAGLALQYEDRFLVGLTLASPTRKYTPRTDAEGTKPVQVENGGMKTLPVLGWTSHLESRGGVPSRLAMGVGIWNTFGGSATFTKPETPEVAIHESTSVLLEFVPGLAYEVNELLSVGVGLRLGMGILSVVATDNGSDAEFSATGFGAGFNAGIMLTPLPELRIGLTYRSPLTAALSGSGEYVMLAGPTQDPMPLDDVTHDQEWPQSASVGAAYQVTPRVLVSTQFDWVDWSRIDQQVFDLRPLYPNGKFRDYDLNDGFALHAGAQVAVTQEIDVRAGYTFDGDTFNDRTYARHFLGGPKHGLAAGGGVSIGKSWRVDTAVEYLFGPKRVVDDNLPEYQSAGWADHANQDPGTHKASLLTFELNAQFKY